jgi:hypothetical protein
MGTLLSASRARSRALALRRSQTSRSCGVEVLRRKSANGSSWAEIVPLGSLSRSVTRSVTAQRVQRPSK